VSGIVLWQLELSHYSEKVRWALDLKRVPHGRRSVLPRAHGPIAYLLTRERRFPVLQLGGRNIGDSTNIIAALEAHAPDPPLYPADPAERERALELEDYFDEHLAPAIRGYAFHHTTRDPKDMLAAVMPDARGARAAVMGRVFAAAAPHVRADYRTSDDDIDRVRSGMDRLERELGGRDYLVGDRFTIADLAGAALFTPVVAPPQRPHAPRSLPPAVLELREELTARPGGQWVFEMYARHR
jgi:glutathione S-transferase